MVVRTTEYYIVRNFITGTTDYLYNCRLLDCHKTDMGFTDLMVENCHNNDNSFSTIIALHNDRLPISECVQKFSI